MPSTAGAQRQASDSGNTLRQIATIDPGDEYRFSAYLAAGILYGIDTENEYRGARDSRRAGIEGVVNVPDLHHALQACGEDDCV